MNEYERVERELGPAPRAGQRSHHVGVVDGALVVVDVWDSRADADRFAAERLFPAFERAGVLPDASVDITAFESVAFESVAFESVAFESIAFESATKGAST